MISIASAEVSVNSARARKTSTSRNKASHPHGTQMIMRWVGPPLEEHLQVDTPCQAEGIWKRFVASADWFDHSKENVVVIAVNARNRFMGWHLVSTGGASGCDCDPREVLRAALGMDAGGIILLHNHPSGVLSPSGTDERATRRVAAACLVVGVRLWDHLIVDSPGTSSYSFRAGYGENFASPGGMDRLLPPPPPPVRTTVNPERRTATRAAKTEGRNA